MPIFAPFPIKKGTSGQHASAEGASEEKSKKNFFEATWLNSVQKNSQNMNSHVTIRTVSVLQVVWFGTEID